jgi:hypothetical protein
MKNYCLKLAVAAMTVGLLAPVEMQAEKPVTRRGTAVMHYMTRNELRTTNDVPVVLGSVRVQMNEQGRSSKQMLDIRLGSLEANTNHNLVALMRDGTNTFVVDDFESNDDGRVRLSYMSKGQGKGGKNPVPESLQPLTDLRAVEIHNAATQTVAFTWIADSARFQYLIKRNLTPEDTNGPAAGSISLIANHKKVNFRLLAGGLSATNDYHLALNSVVFSTFASNEDGRLEIKSWPTNAPAILNLRSLALLDGSSNVVLSTTLPR